MNIVSLFYNIKNTAGTNAKKQMLADNMNDLVKDIFEMTYGEHKYFVSKIDRDAIIAHPKVDGTYITIEEGWGDFKQVLHQCECRHITGNEAKTAIYAELGRFRDEDEEILINILQHNLKIGINADNFYAVIGKPVNKHEVSLAENLNNAKGIDPLCGSYFASRKLDGVRCVAFVETYLDDDMTIKATTPILKSRQNKVFTTLDTVKPYIQFLATKLHKVGKWVFDGEICILDENGDEHFDWVMKEINRKDHTIKNPCYNIFDLITEEEFYGREVESRDIFSHRLNTIEDAYRTYIECADKIVEDYGGVWAEDCSARIHILHQERITCQEDFDRWSQYVKDGNWEGFMLRMDTYYKPGRSKDLLKVKLMQDAEYIVTGTINGVVTYNEGGQKDFNACSALTIEHKGNVVKVGSGLSKEQRLRWYDHPEEIIGKTITVQYFEETMDKKTKQYSLRFPILKYVYENGRDV